MVSVNVSTPRISRWGRARKLGSTYDVMDFVLQTMCYKERERPVTGLRCWPKALLAAGSTAGLGVFALSAFNGEKTFQTRLAGSTKRRAVVNMWNKSIFRAAAVVKGSAAGAGQQLHSGACVLQGRLVL